MFYNPLLPPNAPMKLLDDGGRRYVVDQVVEPVVGQVDRPATQRVTPGPFAFIRFLPSKLPKSLSRTFAFNRKNTAADRVSPTSAQEEALQCVEEQQNESPPPYSSGRTPAREIRYYPEQLPGDTSLSVEGAGFIYPWGAILPFDFASFGTLAPMCQAMPYHLAFYHLHTARRIIVYQGWASISCLIRPMSCCSPVESPTPNSPICRWSSELCLSVECLQKQEFSYVVSLNNADPQDITITMCPHINVALTNVALRPGRDGWPTASAHIQHTERLSHKQKTIFDEQYRYDTHLPALRRRSKTAADIRWDSKTGRLADLHTCEVCHCDLERSLEVRGHELHVGFTVYRNLGTGLDRYDPKWRSLLTGEGDPRPPRRLAESYYGVYRQVMQVAYEFERPNLHPVTFRTPHGDFWVSRGGASNTDHNPPRVKADPRTIRGDPKRGRIRDDPIKRLDEVQRDLF
ncbi:uncharacterized protein PG986_012708 [Apiospora aurea]|uniref:Uncharacterized protein n=1 Tax=Apiospora aurea TaxID=335848 RepID=A0ABR1Q102_9PEZI